MLLADNQFNGTLPLSWLLTNGTRTELPTRFGHRRRSNHRRSMLQSESEGSGSSGPSDGGSMQKMGSHGLSRRGQQGGWVQDAQGGWVQGFDPIQDEKPRQRKSAAELLREADGYWVRKVWGSGWQQEDEESLEEEGWPQHLKADGGSAGHDGGGAADGVNGEVEHAAAGSAAPSYTAAAAAAAASSPSSTTPKTDSLLDQQYNSQEEQYDKQYTGMRTVHSAERYYAKGARLRRLSQYFPLAVSNATPPPPSPFAPGERVRGFHTIRLARNALAGPLHPLWLSVAGHTLDLSANNLSVRECGRGPLA